MSFTILLDDPSLERVALPYVQNLQKLGMEVQVRTVDPAQYQQLMDDYDYDMTMWIYPGDSTSPATSCATTGPARRPRRRAASTCRACAIRRWMRWSRRS